MDSADKSLIQQYIDQYGVRRSKKQKNEFLKYFVSRFSEFEHYAYEQKIGIVKINIHTFGNLENAKTIFLAGFDTVEMKLPGTAPYHPMNAEFNRKNDFNHMILNMVLSLLILASAFFVFKFSMSDSLLKSVGFKLISLVLALSSFFVARGFSNKSNISKTMPLYLLDCIANHRNDSAVIICDYMSYSKLGFMALCKQFDFLNRKEIVYIDSVSVGNDLLIGYTDHMSRQAKNIASRFGGSCELVKIDPAEDGRFDLFDKFLMLATVNKDNDGYFVEHASSKKDSQADLTVVEEIRDILVNL